MERSRKLSSQTRLTLFACALASVVVALGAFTRLVDAGLGCPDWPGCYGQLLWPQTNSEIQAAEQAFPDAPVDTDKTWPEMVHRYFAGTLGLVILAMAILATRARRSGAESESKTPLKLPWFLVILVTIQAAFGMWTVTLKLWPQVVTAHLLGGFATLSLTWLLFLRLWYRGRGGVQQTLSLSARLSRSCLTRLRTLAVLGLAVVVLQVALGGWTSSNYAALACIDFPTCHGEWLPKTDFREGFNIAQQLGPNYLGGLMDNEARTAIHLSHRIGAIIVTLIVLTLALFLWRSRIGTLQRLSQVLTFMLLIQVSLGVTNIMAALPLAVAVAHNVGGALLLLVLVTVNYHLQREALGYDASAQSAQSGQGETAWIMKRS
ncbi:heme A synthase [Pseudomaricurvus alkylphenolicus]|jgi:cytochrome c oxidase assembly protein subunit 15|uniref:COX15/CtaA family protein n=1 Tax=Pseudomaricurvus alkylphenolicus TaxID=1306991 RepID=UPI00141F82C1|nr:COX15/CtaA family protein [Pseudomaricurvus alkylphenolicus]NIB39528.1 heme A synthase [Pseudomaricurvus alkylphenolicus]